MSFYLISTKNELTSILTQIKVFFYIILIYSLVIFASSCNYVTHRTLSKDVVTADEDPEPNYDVTLEPNYQDFVTYIFMGNRSESFGAFFNKFYQAQQDYDDAMKDYRTTTIATYNRRLDSLNITPPISTTAKELLNKVIQRCSKIIQYNKNTRFLDDAVLLVGKSYFYMAEYYQAERKFSEFLSKLTKSPLYDEAILNLGRTRLKLGMSSDGEKILKNLFETTKDAEIKSEIAQELAFNSLSKNDYQGAINYFEQSISFSKDKEKIAEKLYILAKIYSTYDANKAYSEYLKVKDATSDFDLTFYANLNIAKSLNDLKKYDQAYALLIKLNHSYRDFPEYKQLVELEIANSLYYQKKYAEAKQHYFDIIINYTGTKSAADAYYHLAEYSEEIEKNYLNAYANYKKVTETNPSSDFYSYSAKRAINLDKYFSLVAVIKDTAKITLPTENKELEKYKEKIDKEKGIEKKKNEQQNEQQHQQPPNKEGNPPPKGGGEKYYSSLMDSVKSEKKDSTKFLRNNTKDTTRFLKKNIKDTTKILNSPDSSIILINEDSLKSAMEQKTYDSILTAIHRDDSIKVVKEYARFDAYFQLSELFLYDFKIIDSSLYYLNLVVSNCPDSNLIAKALYSIATIYKNQNKINEANANFNRIINQYPNTIFANESRLVLGLPPVEIQKDSSDAVYKIIENYIAGNDYKNALKDLKDFLIKYPESSKRAKAIYTIGWIYEYSFSNKDSSLAYYKKLKEFYPNSDYTTFITPKLEFYASLEKATDSSKAKNDTTKIVTDSTKLLADSTKMPTDSTKILPDSTNKLKDTISKSIDTLKEGQNSDKKEEPEKKSDDSNTQHQPDPNNTEGLKPKN